MKRFVLPALLLLALFGVWEVYVDLAASTRHPPAAPCRRQRPVHRPRAAVEQLPGDRARGAARSARDRGPRARARCGTAFLADAAAGLLSAARGLAGDPVPGPGPDSGRVARFWHPAEIIVVALVSFFSIVVATLAGLAAVDPQLLKLMRTFDASRLRIFRHVELPAALPGLFTGAKIAVAVSVIGAVFAEYNGSNSGLGYLILISIPQLLSARAVAATVVLALFAIVLFGLLSVAERRALPWAYEGDLSP